MTDDGAAHRLFGNSETCEDVRLSLRGGRSMASHRWKNERRHPVSAPVVRGAPDDDRDLGNAAAPDANRHASARTKPRREPAALELAARFCTDITQAQIGKVLAND